MIIYLSVIILFLLLIVGVPVPFCFAGSTIFLLITGGYSPDFLMPSGYSKIANIVLLCIPLFIIAGGIIREGKIGDALVGFVEQFIGRYKSGLGTVTVITCAIFGAISGSAAATLSSVGSIMAPKLIKKGYPRGIGASLIGSSCVLALLIPPSSAQVLYAWTGNQSVLACFLATVGPGLLLAALLSIVQHFQVRKLTNIQSTVVNQINRKNVIKNTGHATPALLMPVIILGGIYGGIMTPMEAAAVAALYCVPVAIFFYKGITFRSLGKTLTEAAASTGAVMLMLMSAMLFSRILVMEHVPDMLLNFMMGITTNKYLILLMLNVLMVIIGMLMDDGSGIMLCTPLLLPIVKSLGVSPIHFAAILGVNLGMGNITPPTAPMLYFASQVGDSPVGEMLKPTMQLIIFAWLPTLIITTYVPELSLTLPRLILGGRF